MVKGQNEPKFFAVEAWGILCTCLLGIKCKKLTCNGLTSNLQFVGGIGLTRLRCTRCSAG